MPAIVTADLVTSSLRLINAIATNETPSANEMADAILVLNDLLESLSTEDITVFSTSDATYSLTANTATYTVGPTGTWVGVRPIEVLYAYTRVNGVDFPCKVTTDVGEYNSISVKTAGSTMPMIALYNAEFPNGQISLWPVPSAAGATFTLTHTDALPQVVNSATTINLPPGYSKMLRYLLGVELATEYGIRVSPEMRAAAGEAKANVQRKNLSTAELDCGPEFTGFGGTGIANFMSGNF